MKTIIIIIYLSLFQFSLPNASFAQPSDEPEGEKLNISTQKRSLTLDTEILKKQLSSASDITLNNPTIIDFPLPNGDQIPVSLKKIKIWEKEQDHSLFWKLKSTKPTNKSHGVISSTALGINGMLVLPNKEIIILKPDGLKPDNNYIVQTRKSIPLSKSFEEILYQGENKILPITPSQAYQQRVNYQGITSYRLAMAATGEFTEFFGSSELATAAIGNMISHVNVIYKRDLGIQFTLVDNTDIIFEHPGEGFAADASLSELVEQNGVILAEQIGTENFDIGHVITVGKQVGGSAYIGAACNTDPAIKASGVTRAYDPMASAFDIDYLSHEMGHQVGATHTFNSDEGLCAPRNRF